VWRAGDRQNAESSYILTGWLTGPFSICAKHGSKWEGPAAPARTKP